jgi:hypothetical protein
MYGGRYPRVPQNGLAIVSVIDENGVLSENTSSVWPLFYASNSGAIEKLIVSFPDLLSLV